MEAISSAIASQGPQELPDCVSKCRAAAKKLLPMLAQPTVIAGGQPLLVVEALQIFQLGYPHLTLLCGGREIDTRSCAVVRGRHRNVDVRAIDSVG